MIQQHPAKIIKADFRKSVVTNSHWHFSSLINENTDFGSLIKFEEITIKPNQSFEYLATQKQQLVLIPIIGALDYVTETKVGFVHINQLETILFEKGKNIVFKNPYENENIAFLLISFNKFTENKTIEFNLEQPNIFLTVLNYEKCKIKIGQFQARTEDKYSLTKNTNGVFAFVLGGVFEFQNRLLENRDALMIWNINEIEFEALLQNSLLLLIETELNNN